MAAVAPEVLKEKIKAGCLVESVDEMPDDYKRDLRHILTVSADTELISAPSYYFAGKKAPTISSYVSALSIIQDELGHAHIAYRFLEELGEDKEYLVFERDPKKFKHPYAFDIPLRSWHELVVANALYDRAGYTLLGDIHKHTSYGPWKRALAKVDKEETFHLRHGEQWMRKLCPDPEWRAKIQASVDWMFPMTIEWFGLPDDLKKHTLQMDYRLKGLTNDQLRQVWMGAVVPLCDEVGIKVPAHFDKTQQKYVLDYHLPIQFYVEDKHGNLITTNEWEEGNPPTEEITYRWNFDEHITWDDVLVRWRGRGYGNRMLIDMVQRGRRSLFAQLTEQ